jgi:hypothetical protein
MTHARRRLIFSISLLVVAFTAWFSWMAYTQSQAQWMEGKVKQAVSASILTLARQWPRIETRSNLTGEVYYAPIINDPGRKSELTRQVLELLNQDPRTPPVKIAQISMWSTSGSSQDTLTSQVILEFPMIGGMEKEITVLNNDSIPHFTTFN